jgi:hypothetical protein
VFAYEISTGCTEYQEVQCTTNALNATGGLSFLDRARTAQPSATPLTQLLPPPPPLLLLLLLQDEDKAWACCLWWLLCGTTICDVTDVNAAAAAAAAG